MTPTLVAPREDGPRARRSRRLTAAARATWLVAIVALAEAGLPVPALHAADPMQQLARIIGPKQATALAPALETLKAADASPAARSAASLSVAQGIEASDAAAGGNAEALAAAADYYRLALPGSSGVEGLAAHNNLAALLLRLGRPEQALEPLRAMEAQSASLDPADRASYLYTYGRALASAGKPDLALPRYRDAVAADATLSAAVTEAERVAPQVEDKAAAVAAFAGVVEALRKARRYDVAGDALAFAFGQAGWVAQPGQAALVTSLVRYFTETGLPPSAYRRRTSPGRASAPTSARSSCSRPS